MNEEIIFKWEENRIKNLLESIFEKVGRLKLNVTVHSPNRQKFGETTGDALRFAWLGIWV